MNDPDKRHALLICHNLRICYFRFEEDMQAAIMELRRKSKLYVPLKWNERGQTYVPQEVLE